MNNILINVNKKTRKVEIEDYSIGNDSENLQGNIVISFLDEFVKGQARLEYKIGDNKYKTVLMEEIDQSYVIPIKSAMTKEGQIYMQLVITEGINEDDIPIFKSNIFSLFCGSSINANMEEPEQYPDWIDIANTKLNRVDNLDIDATKEGGRATITVTKQDKSQQIVEILDGIGTVFTPQTTPKENGTEISWKNEGGLPNPEPALIKNGDKGEPGPKGDKGDTGPQGPVGKDGEPGKNGVSITHSWSGTNLTLTSASGTTTTNLVGPQGPVGQSGVQGERGESGPQGIQGEPGKDGKDGINGVNGKDGITPTIGSNGNWFIGTEDTGKPSRGEKGQPGQNGTNGKDGTPGPKGDKGDTYTLTPQDKTDIANETKEIVMPDLEKQITLVEDKAGNRITLAVDKNYLMTLKLLNSKGKELSTASVDLPLETMVVNARYDSATKELVIVLENGNELKVPIGDLVKGLVSQATFDNAVKSLQGQITANNDELNQVVGEVSDNTKEIGLIKQEQTLLKSNITDLHDKDIELEGKITSNTNRIERVEKSFDKGTAEDEFIHLEDSALAEQQEVELGVNEPQESTEGYNLWNYKNAVGALVNGKGQPQALLRGELLEDGSLLIKQSQYNAGYLYANIDFSTIEPDTNIYISAKVNHSIEEQVIMSFGNIEKLFVCPAGESFIEFSSTYEAGLKKLQLQSYDTIDKIDIKFTDIMIKIGDKAPYEPYTGGIPSPNPNYKQEINKITGSVEYTSTGKNLLPFKDGIDFEIRATDGNYIRVYTENGDLYLNGKSNGEMSSAHYKWKENLNFILKAGNYYLDRLNFSKPIYLNDYETDTAIKTNEGAFTLAKDTRVFLSVYANKPDFTKYKTEIILVAGSETSPYTPYQAISNTIDLKGNEVLPGDKIYLRFNPMTGKYEKILKKNMSEEKKQNVTSVTIAKMKPNGKFYTNVGGTLNEQTITFSKEIADLDVVYELKDDLKTEINLGEIDIMNMTYYPVTNAFTDKENVLIKLGYYRSFPETITNLQVKVNALKKDIPTKTSQLENDSSFITNIPTASKDVLGGVKIGTNLNIDENGVLNAVGGQSGTSNYEELLNKPKINDIELNGNKTLEELGVQAKGDYATQEYVNSSFITATDIKKIQVVTELPSIEEPNVLYLVQESPTTVQKMVTQGILEGSNNDAQIEQ